MILFYNSHMSIILTTLYLDQFTPEYLNHHSHKTFSTEQ